MRHLRSVTVAAWAVVLLAACGGPERGPAPTPLQSAVAFSSAAGRVDVFVNGEDSTSFHFEDKWDKPFLYPLRTASGLVISRGYPVEERPGEHSDHIWHRGIWWGHGDINGVDFWRELGRDKTGTPRPEILRRGPKRKRSRPTCLSRPPTGPPSELSASPTDYQRQTRSASSMR